jgi:hypothetical protein
MEVLRVLSSPDLDVRKKALEIVRILCILIDTDNSCRVLVIDS